WQSVNIQNPAKIARIPFAPSNKATLRRPKCLTKKPFGWIEQAEDRLLYTCSSVVRKTRVHRPQDDYQAYNQAHVKRRAGHCDVNGRAPGPGSRQGTTTGVGDQV